MSDKLDRSINYFRKMHTFKKVLIVFVILLIFIIIVEQPGSEASKRKKSSKFFIPKLVPEEVLKIQISKDAEKIILEKKDGKWRIANGRQFPSDVNKVTNFIKSLHSLKQTSLVSRNPDRKEIYFVDEKNGSHIEIWDLKNRNIADFYSGKYLADGQFLRRTDESNVFQTTPTLALFLLMDKDGWKDKTLLNADESEVRQISLMDAEKELMLEKTTAGDWRVTKPEVYNADSLAIRTLFEQLKNVQAESFADSVDGSQADFSEPDYQISVSFTDDTLKSVSFSVSEEENKYFAKNGEANFVYVVSKDLIDKIFGLEFKTDS